MRWRSPLVRLGIMLLIIGGAFMGYRSYQEHVRNAAIQAEIDTLAREADKIRRENETLAQRIEYFASPDFQEQEAKKKLGLRRQEETMIALREVAVLPGGEVSGSEVVVPTPRTSDSVPNFKKWWRLFFE